MFNLIETAHAAGDGINIHLAPDAIGTLFGIPITNTMMIVWLTMAVLIGLGYAAGKNPQMIPGKLQSAFEALIGGVYDYMAEVLESRDLARKFFPLIMTIFLFILIMNWLGLLPGVDSVGLYSSDGYGGEKFVPFFHPAATDLNITLAFAIISFVAIEMAGVILLGFFKYTGKFINLRFLIKPTGTNILGFFIGLIELVSEIARLVSFSFRLFGNIFAGKTMIVVAIFFVPYVLPVPILAFEMFVGLIQAFIFAILTLFFIKIAIEEPH